VSRRRIRVLLLALLLGGGVVVARLAQVQLAMSGLFRPEDYTRAGGSHIVDTLRGGIYTRWGTPLAVQVPAFDIGVRYDQLLLGCSEPWRQRRVRVLMDEFLRHTRPAASGPEAVWDEYARPTEPGRAPAEPPAEAAAMDRYEYLWSIRSVRSRRHGTLEQYLRRRLHGESRRQIARGAAPPGLLADWRQVLSRLTGRPVEELTAAADRVVGWVSRIQQAVQRASGQDPAENYIRIAEEEQFHPVVEDVPAELAALVRTQPERFPDMCVMERSARRYPNGDLAPHVVGQMALLDRSAWKRLKQEGRIWTMGEPVSRIGKSYTMDERIGVSGAEKAWEDLLRGRRGYVLRYKAFGVLKVRQLSREVPPEPGCDVYLTLREDFQRAANAALARAAESPELDFKAGALVIIDVRDGAVLAAATYPSYDLATYRQQFAKLTADPLSPLLFRPTQAALPTGSVYKVVTAIAALETGAITPSTTFTCRHRELFRAGRSARYFECTGTHGTIALLRAIERSCNIYFYHTGLKAGGEALARWGALLGLGRATGIDLPGERSGQIPVPRSTYGVINLSIGQGNMLCTPLQVAVAMAAIANGGRLYRPHFFDHATDAAGAPVSVYHAQFEQVPLSASTLRVVREGMRLVVESSRGTARYGNLSPFRVAGKTGTAETGVRGLFHAWFAGFAPYDDPKIAFAVLNERTSGHGGSHAAPILRFALEQIWDEVERMG